KSVPKIQPIEYDGKGNVIYDCNTDPIYTAMPLQGKQLTLTIDSSIQHVAEVELSKMLEKTNAERGTVIVLNPKNGEILGLAVLPNYNPENYNKFKQSIVKNWVLSDVYPPGSTFKILTIASAIESGAITKDTKINDTGKITIQGWTIKNYDYSQHKNPGIIDLEYLFEHSSNVGSAKVALEMDKKVFYDMLCKFNLGVKTGIDLPGESSGILPKPKTWDTIRQATIGFGYSIATTPIQIASAVGAIANNGLWVTPHVIKYDEDTAEKKIVKKQVISVETAKIMTELLANSIKSSKSSAGKINHFRVAGKTGTSRKPNENGKGYIEGQVYTSFIGYFPVENPQVLIMVVVDNSKGAGVWGRTIAAPVFNTVATEVSKILNMPTNVSD
ncbi:MAG: penicillin-binding protein 2, partial [Candidatus Gastranaerophilales bacterium]|nr:penicillin-binding protein 2 [Candidatus Gastranaerophilales bacterium]